MNSNIEAERARLQLTKSDLAKTLGISLKTYSNYVQGKTPIPSNILVHMADLFNCKTDYLLEQVKTHRDVGRA